MPLRRCSRRKKPPSNTPALAAILSMLVVSILIAVDGHIHSSDILELQLYVAVMGAMALLFPAFIIIMAGFEWWLARNWIAKGWLT